MSCVSSRHTCLTSSDALFSLMVSQLTDFLVPNLRVSLQRILLPRSSSRFPTAGDLEIGGPQVKLPAPQKPTEDPTTSGFVKLVFPACLQRGERQTRPGSQTGKTFPVEENGCSFFPGRYVFKRLEDVESACHSQFCQEFFPMPTLMTTINFQSLNVGRCQTLTRF